MHDSNSPVYAAIYSGVPVYEVLVREVPIMRRMTDSYMNATQILKVAGFSKPQRTKILEQEVLQGLHEKIQGGYGKYQGTWIPLEAGRELSLRYGVEDLLRPILDFDPTNDPVGQRPASKRVSRGRSNSLETDFDIRTPARSRAPSTVTPAMSPNIQNQEPTPQYKDVPRNFSLPTVLSKRLFDEGNAQRDFFDSVYARKRIKSEELNESKLRIPKIVFKNDEERKHAIQMHIFVNDDSYFNTEVFKSMITKENRFELEIKLDKSNSSLLHWAAAYGRIELVKLLIALGMEINVTNDDGLTPLMQAVCTIRNHTLQSMKDLLFELGPSLFAVDKFAKNCLHYVNELNKFRSKRQISTYYMECIASYIEETRSLNKSPELGDIDAQTADGNTPLHLACIYRNHKNAALLIRLGASKIIKNANGDTPQSLSAHDYRLLSIMVFFYLYKQLENPGAPLENDEYDDIPTTPMSDVSEFSASSSQVESQQKSILIKSNTLSSIQPEISDKKLVKMARRIHNNSLSLNELIYYKDRFQLIQKHTTKIKKIIEEDGNKQNLSIQKSGPINDEQKRPRDRTSSQRAMMIETRLSSQLIRLESLIKASIDEQREMLGKLDRFAAERKVKDERYESMLAAVCKVNEGMIEGLLLKCADQ